MWNCTHFRHPTDKQLGQVDIFFSNYYNLQSVYFELVLLFKFVTSEKIDSFFLRTNALLVGTLISIVLVSVNIAM